MIVQGMHGRDVVDDNGGRLYRAQAGGDVDRRIFNVASILRAGNTFHTCLLSQT